MRNIQFHNGGLYHVYNRGVDKRDIFLSDSDRVKFLASFERGKGIADVHAFCLMGNHFHMLVSQVQDEGISDFMHRLGTSYTMYFNQKYERKGRLFESKFQAKVVASEAYFLHISRYIHTNPVDAYWGNREDTDGVMRFLANFPWSSFRMYLNEDAVEYGVKTDFIMRCFQGPADYYAFVRDYCLHQGRLGLESGLSPVKAEPWRG